MNKISIYFVLFFCKVPNMKTYYEKENEQQISANKRLRDEISNKQSENDMLKSRFKSMEENDFKITKQLEELINNNQFLSTAFENEKQKNYEISLKAIKELAEKVF